MSISFALYVVRTFPATPRDPPTWTIEHMLDFGNHKMHTADALVFGPPGSNGVGSTIWQGRLPETVQLDMAWFGPHDNTDLEDWHGAADGGGLSWTRAGALILQWDAWWPLVLAALPEPLEDGAFAFELAVIALIRALPAQTPIILDRS
jgi:hypothetical protein